MWQKHFKVIPKNKQNKKTNAWDKYPRGLNYGAMKSSSVDSPLSGMYKGHPERISRYETYREMDSDVMVNMALDTICDFMSQKDAHTSYPIHIDYQDTPSDSEAQVINEYFHDWISKLGLDVKMWRIIRNTLKFGDWVFVRDPETLKWYSTDIENVEKIEVDVNNGKKPIAYHIKNIDFNIENMTLTNTPNRYDSQKPMIDMVNAGFSSAVQGSEAKVNFDGGHAVAIPAEHVIHFSLSEEMDQAWPFGESILSGIYKSYRQKALIEDAVIIYRIHRAPERRAFFIDVGDMDMKKANQYMQRIIQQVNQKMLPGRSSLGNGNIVDSSFSPQSMVEDFFFMTNSEGRGSRVETLPGGDALGQIDDLLYFNTMMANGLRVPMSYLPALPGDNNQPFNDGSATNSLISEFRFSTYCERLQNYFHDVLDTEFKLYLKRKGITIEYDLFSVRLNTPQNFAKYRQIELDSARISLFSQIEGFPYISRQFAMKKWLGMDEDEMIENEQLLMQENPPENDSGMPGGPDTMGGLGGAPGEDLSGMGDGMLDDEMDFEDTVPEESMGDEGGPAPTEGGVEPAPSPE